jgi:(E)-4-hydroxy-3-methylbut-2-enyl-diphosphate synthase
MSSEALPGHQFEKYCLNPYHRERLHTIPVNIGITALGGENPIRVQSMTTTDTMDTEKSVDQSIRMIDAGCELVRLTAPSKKEAENLREIKKVLTDKGYHTPLVADIHFTPNAAEIAANIVEKVRVNPGNYADKKKFEHIEYTNESYDEELRRIEEKFTPLVLLCEENGTAMRIGTNHGSLSDRILSRYGDTPEGMVESAYEFITICEKNGFDQLVISMKASNTIVMVQAYRLLVARMLKTGKCYPIHLGVTEAGDGEDGRIKSAVGIGCLLEDGIGDTVRVSLTEEPEFEIPVAKKLIQKFEGSNPEPILPYYEGSLAFNPFSYHRRGSTELGNIGGKQVPVVIGDLSSKIDIAPANLFALGYNYSVQLDKWNIQDLAADYVYIGDQLINFELPGTLGVICSFQNWLEHYSSKKGFYPVISDYELAAELESKSIPYFLRLNEVDLDPEKLLNLPNARLILYCTSNQYVHQLRFIQLIFANYKIKNPVVLENLQESADPEEFQLYASSEVGTLLIDGFGDGIFLISDLNNQLVNSTSFGILQATRTRISKTEYISCPSCGRTLFDLQETTAKIREKTHHLKGIKIGIMGCIVNGPGEMADADYGYVGTGPGKINLYKEKTMMKRNVPETEAVSELIELIKSHGDWKDPK